MIGTDRVVTAAHCIDPAGPYQAQPSSIEVIVAQTSMCAGEDASLGKAAYGYCKGTDLIDTSPNGTGQPFATGSRISVASISLHPQADVSNFYDDVAILTLARPVPAELVVTLADPEGAAVTDTGFSKPEGWGPNTPTSVFGWGATYYGQISQPNVLNMAGGNVNGVPILPRLDDLECAKRFGAEFRAGDMLCAGSRTGRSGRLTPARATPAARS